MPPPARVPALRFLHACAARCAWPSAPPALKHAPFQPARPPLQPVHVSVVLQACARRSVAPSVLCIRFGCGGLRRFAIFAALPHAAPQSPRHRTTEDTTEDTVNINTILTLRRCRHHAVPRSGTKSTGHFCTPRGETKSHASGFNPNCFCFIEPLARLSDAHSPRSVCKHQQDDGAQPADDSARINLVCCPSPPAAPR